MNQEYGDFKKWLSSFAVSFHKTTGLPYPDLKMVADLAFVEACNSYDQEKSSFRTYLYHITTRSLSTYCRKQKTIHNVPAFSKGLSYAQEYPASPEEKVIRKDLIEKASNDFKAMLKLLCEQTEKLCEKEPVIKKRKIKKNLRRMLKKQKHWTNQRVNAVFEEATNLVAQWR